MSVETLMKDCEAARRRLVENPLATSSAVSAELANNVYPMIKAALSEIIEVDEIVQEVIEQTESFLQKDTADQIVAALTAGGQMAKLITDLIQEEAGSIDDLRAKKFADAVAVWTAAAVPAAKAVHEAMITDDDDEDEDDEDGDSKSDDESEEK